MYIVLPATVYEVRDRLVYTSTSITPAPYFNLLYDIYETLDLRVYKLRVALVLVC